MSHLPLRETLKSVRKALHHLLPHANSGSPYALHSSHCGAGSQKRQVHLTSGPLHLLFPFPRTPFLQYLCGLLPHFIQLFAQMSLDAFLDHPVRNFTSLPNTSLQSTYFSKALWPSTIQHVFTNLFGVCSPHRKMSSRIHMSCSLLHSRA